MVMCLVRPEASGIDRNEGHEQSTLRSWKSCGLLLPALDPF